MSTTVGKPVISSMDETGIHKQPTLTHDAEPSTSKKIGEKILGPEVKKRKTPQLPEIPLEPKEDNFLELISTLLTTLLATTFRFKEPEERSLLKQLCDTLSSEAPEKKIEIGEVVDMYYELEDGSSVTDVAAQFHKRHANADRAPVAESPKMEVDIDAVPSNTPANLEMEARRQKRIKELKPELLCKVCLDSQVAVTFVPCGHLVTCVSCTAALFECPVCRAHIRGTIRTYI